MLFSSAFFLFVFLPILLVIYYKIAKTHDQKNRILLFASLIFYAWGEPLFVFIMIGCIYANYYFGKYVENESPKYTKKTIIIAMLIFNLGMLGIFKYSAFCISNLNSLFSLGLKVPTIALPIGISFFTFQGISYVIDVYRKKAKAFTNPMDVGLYIAFFPQLIAGPIVRYETIAQELRKRKATDEDFVQGISRFIIGMAKKVILANQFALIADKAYSFDPSQISATFAWLGALAYMLQIYFDFSGYSDMAIGMGRWFGFHFPENFNKPYTAKSISDFWRRWHISLGTWFKDYVYIPLGGSRTSNILKLRNLAIVWILTGVWHGANWTFIVWGAYFGILIIIEKFTGLDKVMEKSKVIGHLYALIAVLFGWVIFRASTLTDAIAYINAMFGVNGASFTQPMALMYLKENIVLYIIGIGACVPFLKKDKEHTVVSKVILTAFMTVIFLISISYLVKGTYNPFIYFNF